MTCSPICSAVVPGSCSYRDKPMATIGILRFVEESFRKVRYNPDVSLESTTYTVSAGSTYHYTSGEESTVHITNVKPSVSARSNEDHILALHLHNVVNASEKSRKLSANVDHEKALGGNTEQVKCFSPIAISMSGLNSAIFSADLRMRL